MRLIIRSDGIPFLVGMATSEHLVMQNESLVSLTLIATSVLGKKIYFVCPKKCSIFFFFKFYAIFFFKCRTHIQPNKCTLLSFFINP